MMVIIAEMNVLAVGVKHRTGDFESLPVRLLDAAGGSEAIHSFRTGSIDSVISHWNLPDMPDGEFLRKLKTARPDMPTVVIIEPNNPQQEVEARMLGVNAVISEDCDEDFFRGVVTGVLGLPNERTIEALYAVKEFKRS